GKRVAVLFSGGPAAGGHNVLCGMLAALGVRNTLLGVYQGPKGLIKGDLFEIAALDEIQNMGGFNYLGSDRTKIKTDEQFDQVRETVKKHRLDGIVIIGGDDSNTNAAVLAEKLYGECVVVGVPKTIDGDLQVGKLLPISFGFDTATKIYAELVGNILQDAPSSLKYWHFVKLMGRAASQVALEVALQTHPPITLISEEIQCKNMSLQDIITGIAETVIKRAAHNLPYGVVLVPEGLIEFIPEFKSMIAELNDIIAEYDKDLEPLRTTQKLAFLEAKLSDHSGRLMASLPESVKNRLVLDRDSHGNLQVSHIPTEELLIEMVGIKVQEIKNHPDLFFGAGKMDVDAAGQAQVQKFKFNPVSHFFGYEGRCGLPTVFDATFTYNLGLVAASLVLGGHTGYMASLTDLDAGGTPLALPLTRLLSIERRNGKSEWVIQKALVSVDAPAFRYFAKRR
ncbi:MAG: diphosphate--fructose-6-phosphate 1-phosphotransferase, partial [Candidatus Margulisiibacteriota bacterium]